MNRTFLRNIIITVLVVVLIGGLIVVRRPKKTGESSAVPANQPKITLTMQTEGLGNEIGDSAKSIISEMTGVKVDDTTSLSSVVRQVIYSDLIVNTVMSVSYPLLFNVLTDLEFMDFASYASLGPTGTAMAELLSGTNYTCLDKDGTRKPLTDVLSRVANDWTYMDTVVTYEDESGKSRSTTLWNSISWGVKDQNTFYSAMADMSAGLKGVLQITIQSNPVTVNLNVIDYLLHTDAIPFYLDAAVISNDSSDIGYQLALVSLFNMLGLVDGEYPSAKEVQGYTNLGDIWKAIFEPVIKVVEKAEKDPVQNLTSILVNFSHAMDTGALVNGLQSLRLDVEYHKLAELAMGFKSGPLYNLGDSLIDIIESFGLNLRGNFNDLLDSLLVAVTKNKSANLPEMDTAKLLTLSTPNTLTNGNVHYVADADAVVDFLVDYVIQEDTVQAVLDAAELTDSETASALVGAVGQSREGMIKLVGTLADLILSKLKTTE